MHVRSKRMETTLDPEGAEEFLKPILSMASTSTPPQDIFGVRFAGKIPLENARSSSVNLRIIIAPFHYVRLRCLGFAHSSAV